MAAKVDIRKHNTAWEQESWAKGWLKSICFAPDHLQSTGNFSWCVACNTALKAQKKDLKRHSESSKHKKNFDSLFAKNTLLNYEIVCDTTSSKILDIKLAIFTAKHTSIESIDHLTNLLKSLSIKDFEKLRLHRTKCTAIIKNVVAPVLLSTLVSDIGDSKYSLILDESTDISRNKWMSLCVRYLSKEKCLLKTKFLGIFLVEEATAEKLYEGLRNYLKKVGLNPYKILAIGTDGASNLCGKNKSLYTLLKNDNRHLILVKCTCHSIRLCYSESSKEFPPDVEFLVREIYNYFSNSPLRTSKYKQAFDLINTGFDTIKFKKLIQISATRWLFYGLAVKRLLEQWIELKYHLSIIATAESEKTAQIIYDLMCNDEIKLYLIFMAPILSEMNRLNLNFQSDQMDAGTVYDTLLVSLLSIATRVLKPAIIIEIRDEKDMLKILNAVEKDSSYLPLEAMDLGYGFEEEIKTLPPSLKLKTKNTCFLYLKSLLTQMLKRFPPNLLFFKTYKQFSPKMCCNVVEQPKFCSIFSLLQSVINVNTPRDVYEPQWRKLPFVNWKGIYGDSLPSFWTKVYQCTDAAGSKPFEDLAGLVLNMLSVPTSNACVERVFSIMNTVKTKIRNSIQYELLEALLRINTYFINNSICCESFNPSTEMIKLFNIKTMYKKCNGEEESEDYESEVFDILKLNEF